MDKVQKGSRQPEESYSFLVNSKNQRVSFSLRTWQVINYDRQNFGSADHSVPLSRFISHIVIGYAPDSEAMIERRIEEKEDYLCRILKEENSYNTFDEDEVNRWIEKMLEVYAKEINERVYSRVNVKTANNLAVPIYLNKDFEYFLQSADSEKEATHYQGNIGKYIRAIIEEYTEKEFTERERIYYYRQVEQIEQAMVSEYCLEIFLLNGKTYFLKPLLITTDPLMPYNYVLGVSRAVGTDSSRWTPDVFRLANIKKTRLVSKNSISGKITEKEKKKIMDTIEQKGVAFMPGEVDQFTVRFTENGKKMLHNILFMRPPFKKINDKDTYLFTCSQFQMRLYLERFGCDAEVISPERLKHEMTLFYEKAYRRYSGN